VSSVLAGDRRRHDQSEPPERAPTASRWSSPACSSPPWPARPSSNNASPGVAHRPATTRRLPQRSRSLCAPFTRTQIRRDCL